MPEPVLVFAYGNPSRGDDALAPTLLERLQTISSDWPGCEFLTDFQLQIEHALDLQQRRLVLFIDAATDCAGPFELSELAVARDDSYSTHAMSPAAVLHVYRSVVRETPPPAFLLKIKAEKFELGEGLSGNAVQHLQQAGEFVERLLGEPCADAWRQMLVHSHA